jgi:methyl-accepting chemotaxis protein
MMNLGLFESGPIPDNAIIGYYNLNLVFLSYIVASLASFFVLEISQEIRHSKRSTFWLLIGGACAMGAGIFSMHFIGMLAYIMPMPAQYDLFLTFLSLIIAIVASYFALYLVKDLHKQINHLQIILGGFVLGIAIASMHYTGMSAMIGMQNTYLPGLFTLSILVAIIASITALYLMMECDKGSLFRQRTLKVVCALIMGAAISGMHYIGMAATIMTPTSAMNEMETTSSLLSPEKLSFFIAFTVSSIIIIALLLIGYKHLIMVKMLIGFMITPLFLTPLVVIWLQNINDVNRQTESGLIYILATALIFILSIIACVLIALDIIKPLKNAVSIVNMLRLGELNFNIENHSKNETGQLLDAMKLLALSEKKMSTALTSVSKGDLSLTIEPRSENDLLGLALVSMIKSLRTINGNIKDEVINLTTSSEQIANSVSQAVNNSAETADVILQTKVSLEELKNTTQIANVKTKDVLDHAEITSQIVKTSENLVQATINDMHKINEKMQIISDSIVKLNENSNTIRIIIDSVNDLADQSNLLAVNAAIEAAIAGEQGKSFAVIAKEIRVLAEQSKAATQQVRSLLNQIQNTTSDAVLATEQGSNAVENGVKQSAQTNESMKILSKSITEVTQAANQIAISSQEQFAGVEKVTTATDSISMATTHLIAYMKSIEFSLASLKLIGCSLKEMTDHFNMEKDHTIFKDALSTSIDRAALEKAPSLEYELLPMEHS